MTYDAILLVSFGGPETNDDVLPFLERVLAGRNVPRERMLEVAEHYYHFGGKSPINDQNRALLDALRDLLDREGPPLPIYWGNRNWHPLLPDTLRQMQSDGIRHALAFVTSAFSSYSGCRQYREDIQKAQAQTGENAPTVDKVRAFFNHPGYIQPVTENLNLALAQIPEPRRAGAQILFTAHSIPSSMAATSRYESQLREASRLVAEAANRKEWQLVFQSRSGPPSQPWLEPDVGDAIRASTAQDIVLVPIGFLSDHMEVLYDLDEEARHIAHERNLNLVRAATVGTHPKFVAMIRDLILERINESPERPALGILGPVADVCPLDCCPAPTRPKLS